MISSADEPAIKEAAEALRSHGVKAEALEADLATVDGAPASSSARSVIETSFISQCRPRIGPRFYRSGMGQNPPHHRHERHRYGVPCPPPGYQNGQARPRPNPVHRLDRRLHAGTFQAVYNATKAFIESFAIAFRHELQDTGVSVTVLTPGATQTRFFERAEMLDTKIGTDEKDNPANVAKAGYDALMAGDDQVVSAWKNKLQAAAAHVTPAGRLAQQHRKMAEPGSASQD